MIADERSHLLAVKLRLPVSALTPVRLISTEFCSRQLLAEGAPGRLQSVLQRLYGTIRGHLVLVPFASPRPAGARGCPRRCVGLRVIAAPRVERSSARSRSLQPDAALAVSCAGWA